MCYSSILQLHHCSPFMNWLCVFIMCAVYYSKLTDLITFGRHLEGQSITRISLSSSYTTQQGLSKNFQINCLPSHLPVLLLSNRVQEEMWGRKSDWRVNYLLSIQHTDSFTELWRSLNKSFQHYGRLSLCFRSFIKHQRWSWLPPAVGTSQHTLMLLQRFNLTHCTTAVQTGRFMCGICVFTRCVSPLWEKI